MSNSKLPERASLEYLKKLAKERLQELRRGDPRAKLAAALLAVAREHGFSSWRALKAETEQRRSTTVAAFFDACVKGDVDVLRRLLADDPSLIDLGNPQGHHAGWTGPDSSNPCEPDWLVSRATTHPFSSHRRSRTCSTARGSSAFAISTGTSCISSRTRSASLARSVTRTLIERRIRCQASNVARPWVQTMD